MILNESLPQSAESERAILGGLLLNNNSIRIVRDSLTPGDFYLPSHVKIYRAIVALAEGGKAVDPLLLVEALKSAGELEDVGGVAYIASLTDGVAGYTNLDSWAAVVKEKSLLRRTVKACGWITDQAMTGGSSEEILLKLANWCSKARAGIGDGGLVEHSDVVRRVFQQIQNATLEPDVNAGIPTGLARVDAAINGMERGDLITLAGGSSLGKTTMALQWALAAAENKLGRKVVPLYVSLEMPPERLVYKLFSAQSKLPVRSLKRGWVTDEQMIDLTDVAGRLEQIEMAYVARLRETGSAVSGLIERLQIKTDNKAEIVVFVDTLQLFARGESNEDQFAAIARASEQLKQLTIDYNIPIVQLSQLTFDAKYSVTQEPTEQMLRGAKSIYHDSDKVFFLHCPDGIESNRRQLIKRKDRDGERVEYFELMFEGRASRFVEAE